MTFREPKTQNVLLLVYCDLGLRIVLYLCENYLLEMFDGCRSLVCLFEAGRMQLRG